ncbi:hypothetical protein K438DRAFT_2032838, partial [Mycena galopus ATCC 62051]
WQRIPRWLNTPTALQHFPFYRSQPRHCKEQGRRHTRWRASDPRRVSGTSPSAAAAAASHPGPVSTQTPVTSKPIQGY